MAKPLIALTSQAPATTRETKRRIEASPLRASLVDLSGEYSIRYTPLGIMAIRAAAVENDRIRAATTVRLHAYTQQVSAAEMIADLAAARPHVLGFSVQGWNLRQLATLFPPLRQLLPEVVIVLGGNHVSHRGDIILGAHPAVDIVANGEGEQTFSELLLALLDGTALEQVAGLSFRTASGRVHHTAQRERIKNIADTPSAYSAGHELSGYDIALLETNRGCPYHCAFCFWGGAVGQRLARGPVERAREEIEAIAKAGIETIFLCDANFGILEQDLEVTDLIIDAYRRYGAPRAFNVNWAKNHAERVGEILRRLLDAGIHTAINIPLQTMSSEALALADRHETGRAKMMEQALRLVRDGVDVACEMIFGLPGETLEEFQRNYDGLFAQFPFLRIHPLWLLPNTTYSDDRDRYQLVGFQPDPTSDYEAPLQHNTMTAADMRDGLAFLMAHQILVHLAAARNALRACACFTGMSIANALVTFEGFLASREDDLSRSLYALFERVRSVTYFERPLRDRKRQLVYRSREATLSLVCDFLDTLPLDDYTRDIAVELAKLDAALLPRGSLCGDGYALSDLDAAFDVVELSRMLRRDPNVSIDVVAALPRTKVILRHKSGLGRLNGSNCDLTGAWNGQVLDSQHVAGPTIVPRPAAPRTDFPINKAT